MLGQKQHVRAGECARVHSAGCQKATERWQPRQPRKQQTSGTREARAGSAGRKQQWEGQWRFVTQQSGPQVAQRHRRTAQWVLQRACKKRTPPVAPCVLYKRATSDTAALAASRRPQPATARTLPPAAGRPACPSARSTAPHAAAQRASKPWSGCRGWARKAWTLVAGWDSREKAVQRAVRTAGKP